MAFIEVLGIASILPFMAVLAHPEVLDTNQWLRVGYDGLGFQETTSYLFFLGLLALILLIISNCLKAGTRWLTLRFSFMCGDAISRRLFAHYLNSPYSFFLTRNSTDLGKNVLIEVHTLTHNFFLPAMDVIAKLLVTITIFSLLIVVNPFLALTTAIVLGGAYSLVYAFFHRRMLVYGKARQGAIAERHKLVAEAFQGIKTVKLTGQESTYLAYFDRISRSHAANMTRAGVVGELPRYALEIIGFGGILLIVLYLLVSREGLGQALPLMALYAFAGYRLMPNMQSIYSGATTMRFHLPVLKAVTGELESAALASEPATKMEEEPNAHSEVRMPFSDSIRFRGVCFRYDGTTKDVISNLDLEIWAGSRVGIVGASGSGKTTVVDVLIGLLRPNEGEILIDGEPLCAANLAAWQRNVAYVSQHIYLCDDTIRRNIAFGAPEG